MNANDYRTKLKAYDSSYLLKKSLDSGEISLIEYLMEFTVYYESMNQLLQMERELQLTLAELNRYL